MTLENTANTAASNESITLLVKPGLTLTGSTATLVCPVSGSSTVNIIGTTSVTGSQSVTLTPINTAPLETCTLQLDFTSTIQLEGAADTVAHLPSNKQASRC